MSLDRAISFAVSAHHGQTDRAGMSYMSHVCSVITGVATEQEKIVAALHDVVEDSNTSLDTIENSFGAIIRHAVDAITKREDEHYAVYLARVKANELARTVKLADLAHNMQFSRIPEMTDKDWKRMDKYDTAVCFLAQRTNP